MEKRITFILQVIALVLAVIAAYFLYEAWAAGESKTFIAIGLILLADWIYKNVS